MLTGSSPRVRGTRPGRRSSRRSTRFIPACAGNATIILECDHHRHRFIPACAGNARGPRPAHVGHRGSSPRVRGTRLADPVRRRQRRFIPACAGNARRRAVRGGARAVHPRVCGERRHHVAHDSPRIGSSPRVRGTPAHRTSLCLAHRFIPACAGNARSRCTWIPATPVHPRVCGERLRIARHYVSHTGSSPRVRGTQRRRQRRHVVRRFIPACAGNASTARRAPRAAAVHPRVCGERSSHNLLIDESYPNMSLSTGKFGNVLLRSKRTAPLSYAQSVAGGRKRTSFMPSKSAGVRRLTPQVSKS